MMHLLYRIFLFGLFLLIPSMAFGQPVDSNSIESISVASEAGSPGLILKATQPIGYRYTVYESSNPERIVVDFRGMSVSGGEISIPVGKSGIERAVAKQYDLTSGQLGRVEIFTQGLKDFRVDVQNDTMTINVEADAATLLPSDQDQPVAIGVTELQKAIAPAVSHDQPVAPFSLVVGDVDDGMRLKKRVSDFKYFPLKGPSRLVLDIFDNSPVFLGKSFDLEGGFERVRVGRDGTKVRFVFDARGETLPVYEVKEQNGKILIAWDGVGKTVDADITNASVPVVNSGPVYVEALGFYQDSDSSILSITTSRKARIIAPTLDGNMITFGLKDARIKNSLMRAIDTSSFPSAVNLVTPYAKRSGDTADVRFSIEVKGPVEFRTEENDGKILVVVNDGPFRKIDGEVPTALDVVSAPVDSAELSVQRADNTSEINVSDKVSGAGKQEIVDLSSQNEAIEEPEETVSIVDGNEDVKSVPVAAGRYKGQRISLIFDNADIHQILNLIADVSGLNIIAKRDEVTGKLSIRLIDVPWDHAFAVVLDLMELEKIESNSVIRVLPREKARQIAQDRWDEVKSKEEREELIDAILPVSYSSLTDISSAVKKLSSPRGKITEDERSKQLIVTDIPSVVERIKGLVRTLDSPERQVMIEARIVEADSSFGRDLGVNWGFSRADSLATGSQPSSISAGLGGSFLIGVPDAGSVGSEGMGVGLRFGQITDSRVLDLRLSALETSGRGKVVSSPRISTLNGKEATISQGNEIPYATTDDSGVPTISFKQATLELKVKPVINPDRSILLEINAKNDAVGQSYGDAGPAINKKEAKTNVLLRDGDTTVIGGIFVETESESETGVPLLMHIPILRHLFKSTNQSSRRNELLIFITPRILD